MDVIEQTIDEILNTDLPILISASYLSKYSAYEIMKTLHYIYDRELSTDQNRVYKYSHNNMNEIVIVYRGTSNCYDWYTNFLCFFGLKYLSSRCWRSIDIVKKAKTKYGKDKKIHVIGHSLGAFLCELSRADGLILTYNKLVSLTDIGKTINLNQYDIREKCDIVSILETNQHGGKKETINIKDKNPLHAHTTDDMIEARDHIML